MRFQWFSDRSTEDVACYNQALRAYRLDPEQRFIDVKKRVGFQASSIYAHMYFSNQSVHKRLLREIELPNLGPRSSQNLDVFLVPPPENLGTVKEGKQFLNGVMRLAASGSFDHVSLIRMGEQSALSGAKHLYHRILERKRRGRSVILVSYSFGSSCVRVMLDQMTPEEREPICGWLNISGVLFGTPRFHCSDKNRWFEKKDLRSRSFSSEQTYFRQAYSSYGIRTVHILGMKSDSRHSFLSSQAQDFLKPWGPNDGWVPFAPYQFIGEPVLSLMDQGHSMNLRKIPSTILGLLSHYRRYALASQ